MGQDKKLFIAVPVYDSAPAAFLQSMAALTAQSRVPARVSIKHGDSLVTRARNVLTADFLESGCTHLLFVDCDLIFSPEDVARITSHDVDVVGGMYPLKREGQLLWCGNGQLEPKLAAVRGDGLQEVRYIGTGFMCIRRAVFERMLEADQAEIEYQADEPPHRTEWDFWRVGARQTADARRRYLSEDWFFCQRWLELGGKVYADTRVQLRHVGTAVWPLLSQRQGVERGSVERGSVEQGVPA